MIFRFLMRSRQGVANCAEMLAWRCASAWASAAAPGGGLENLNPCACAETAANQQASKMADDVRIAELKLIWKKG
jgi:hypothetical protein